MAIAVAQTAPFGSIATYQMVSTLTSVVDAVWEEYKHLKTVRALSQLTDAQLEDIGISRYDLKDGAIKLR